MKVLVCTDFSAAAAVGEREAAARYPGAELVVFHCQDVRLMRRVVEATGFDGAELAEGFERYADQRLHEVIERLVSQGHRVTADLVEGDPVDQAIAAAARHGVDLIVLGVATAESVGRFRTLLGRKTRTPVLMVPYEE